jgi:hypothetical protein
VGGGGGDAGVQGCQVLGGRVTCWERATPVALLGPPSAGDQCRRCFAQAHGSDTCRVPEFAVDELEDRAAASVREPFARAHGRQHAIGASRRFGANNRASRNQWNALGRLNYLALGAGFCWSDKAPPLKPSPNRGLGGGAANASRPGAELKLVQTSRGTRSSAANRAGSAPTPCSSRSGYRPSQIRRAADLASAGQPHHHRNAAAAVRARPQELEDALRQRAELGRAPARGPGRARAQAARRR